jgi:hypothetical protein
MLCFYRRGLFALLFVASIRVAGGQAVTSVAMSVPSPRLPRTIAHQVAESSIFAPLALSPAPSDVRLATGAPGPRYWQNRTDYDLAATLDPATHTLHGSMVLHYTNNSPDTLKELWFQTEQLTDVIERFDQVVRGKPVAVTYDHPTGDVLELHVTPAQSVPPRSTATFQVQWHFEIRGDGGRMGRDGATYEIAQWYPRPNVYDDVNGWNTASYATGAEFYLEYGDYTMALTVPATDIVAATGTLTNPRQVLTPTERARLAQAATSDTAIAIITAAELANGRARPTPPQATRKRGGTNGMLPGMLTWKFSARNVRDAVWAASPEYQWDATRWHGVLAQAYYRPSSQSWGQGEAALDARAAIEEYSERWYPYPYPQVSVVDGPVFGMEYPMLSFDGDVRQSVARRRGIGNVRFNGQRPHRSIRTLQYALLTHEVGHDWFPMLVGSNERLHTWMDEGFNTFINSFAEARYDPSEGNQNIRMNHQVYDGTGAALETGQVIGNASSQYAKTAYALQLLRRDILGPERFDRAFRTYIRRWVYKHPTPADFFRTMNDVSGQNLDWFWRAAFLEASRFDQAIDSVAQTTQGGQTRVTVKYGNRGRMQLPILVRFTLADGTTRDVTHPVDVWRANPAAYTTTYTFAHPVTRITLDPETHLPDADPTNNDWTAQHGTTPP